MSRPGIYRLPETPFSPEQLAKATKAAQEALQNAYAPYSRFQVGCGILCANDSVFRGCNVETANYDGTHAEEAALAAMVAAGRRDPVLCVCMGALEGKPPTYIMSCGKCRQTLLEFSSLSGRELWLEMDPVSGPQWTTDHWLVKLSDILPLHFGPADIGVDLAKYRR